MREIGLVEKLFMQCNANFGIQVSHERDLEQPRIR